ncbi:hypothetical protein [Thalassotalea agarivorans]|uniref:Winged helix DNA-binding domain-containing protein n=1 Tax=Thalassotalea agarivorans TaxID=349064 RepID=A0A1I0E7V7_THASX|nr:hypothetical protein [Thalassotalea agarivorans]SET40373.1 hypothetical protein SAMN05660429_01738 [Thalassotalea agarivorans]
MDFLSSVKGLFDSIIDGAKERIVNPFTSGFLVAWIFFNWKGIYFFMTGDGTTIQKITHIESVYSDINTNFYYPLLVSFLYVTLFPLVKEIAISLWTIAENLGKSLSRWSVPNLAPISKAEKAALINLMNTKEKEFKEKLREKDEQIEALQSLVRSEESEKDNDLTNGTDIPAVPPSELFKDIIKSASKSATPKESKQDRMEYNESVRRYFTTADGQHYLRNSVADKLNLSRENPNHAKDIELSSVLLERAMRSEDETVKEVGFDINVNGKNKGLVTSAVNAALDKLRIIGYLEKLDKKDGFNYYKLTDEGKRFLTDILQNNKVKAVWS